MGLDDGWPSQRRLDWSHDGIETCVSCGSPWLILLKTTGII